MNSTTSHLGIVFEETTTREFSFIFDSEQHLRPLKFSFVQVHLEKEEFVVAKVVDVNTDNPLLAKDTAKFYAEKNGIAEILPDVMSKRFMLYKARCEVVGKVNKAASPVKIEPLTQAIKTGSKVEPLDKEILSKLYSDDEPHFVQLGKTYSQTPESIANVSLNADELTTMHTCIFGMSGMGKTTTTATLLEELIFRGGKIILFDPHADYVNLNRLSSQLKAQFCKVDSGKLRIRDPELEKTVNDVKQRLKNYYAQKNKDKVEWADESQNAELEDANIIYRLLGFRSVLHGKIIHKHSDESIADIEHDLIKLIKLIKLNTKAIPDELFCRKILDTKRCYPQIKRYESKSVFYTIRLIEAMAGEEITDAQMGYYVDWIDGNEEKGTEGLKKESDGALSDGALIEALIKKIEGPNSASNSKSKSNQSKGKQSSSNKSSAPMLRQLSMAKKTLSSLDKKGIESLEVEEFVNDFCKTDGKLKDVAVTCFDLSDLESDEVRRALIYAVVSFIFEKYKSKELSIEENAYPILFAIEEARTLIPRAMGDPEMDKPATRLARSAVRSIATEGRKMGLGLLVISQTPSSVDNLITSQANTQILHRMTNPDDLTYIKQISESLSQEDLENLKTVGEGTAIVTGVAMKTRTSILVDVRMRYSEEGKQKPTPFKDRLKGLKQNLRTAETDENWSDGMPTPIETGKADLSNDEL
jgi:DNA helicase HerA-like ATPase